MLSLQNMQPGGPRHHASQLMPCCVSLIRPPGTDAAIGASAGTSVLACAAETVTRDFLAVDAMPQHARDWECATTASGGRESGKQLCNYEISQGSNIKSCVNSRMKLKTP